MAQYGCPAPMAAGPAALEPGDPYARYGPAVPAACWARRRSAMDCSVPEGCLPAAPTTVDHREAAAPAALGPGDPSARHGPGVPAACCAWCRSAMGCSVPKGCFPAEPTTVDHREAAAPAALGPGDPSARHGPGVPAVC